MIAMDKVHSIRQLFYEQGKSVSAIAAETGHDRKTISKYLDMTDFNTPEPKKEDPENMCPKLDAYKPLIDQWLLDDRKAPRKQRHTADCLGTVTASFPSWKRALKREMRR